jgi:multidrug efflux pump subunit AcrB
MNAHWNDYSWVSLVAMAFGLGMVVGDAISRRKKQR